MEKEKLFLIGLILKSIEDDKNYLNEYEATAEDFNDLNCLTLFEKLKELKTINFIDCFNELSKVDDNLFLFQELKDKNIDLQILFDELRENTIKRKLSLIGEDVKNLKDKNILKKWLSLIEELEKKKKVETVNSLIFKYINTKKGEQIKCGFNKLNKHLYLQKGQLMTIGARPSIGKTWLMVQMAIDIANRWKKVLFFNLEMDEKVVMDRMLSYITNTDNTVYKYWTVQPTILNRWLEELKKLENHLFFENKKRIDSEEIIRTIKRNRPDVVFIDYLWLLDDKLEKWQLKAYMIGEITRNLKIVAGEYDCLIVVASQLNRWSTKEKRPPAIDDLRDSGAIEQDSDVVLLLHRENRDEPETEIIIWKNRNWYVGKIDMMMKLETTSFYEI